MSNINPVVDGSLPDQLTTALGPDQVLRDPVDLDFFSRDVFGQGQALSAVVVPDSIGDLQTAVRLANAAGVPMLARGGGMSYSDAFLASRPGSLLFDFSRLNRIVEINREDRYVTVEAGCTWDSLQKALAAEGLRTPFWGPLSGFRATVGGTLAQGSVFLGSGRHGTVADSLLGLEVVTGTGERLKTGSAAGAHATAFFRYHGPDLSGIFTGDGGALGFKVRATFQLIRIPSVQRHLSFVFDDHVSLMTAMAGVARLEVVSECFAFDPFLAGLRLQRASLKEDVRALSNVVKSAGGLARGIKEGARLVAGGRDFLGEGTFSMHLSLDAEDDATADAAATRVRKTVAEQGREVENSIPKVMRSQPFGEVTSMLGPRGQRWAPVHGIVPPSRAAAAYESLEDLFDTFADERSRYHIDHGYLMSTVGNSGFLIEPCLYWPDARTPFHERVLDAGYLARIPQHPEDLAARAAVGRLRDALAQRFHELGAASFQIGKFYRYREGRDPSFWALLRAIKAQVDPKGLLNPGALGLDA